MSITLRVVLFLISALTTAYVIRKIRKSQVQIEDTVFWILLSIVFVVLSVFPSVAVWFADMIGIQTPVNFIFLCVIFLLLIKLFLLSVKVSQLESKLSHLVREMALKDSDEPRQAGDAAGGASQKKEEAAVCTRSSHSDDAR